MYASCGSIISRLVFLADQRGLADAQGLRHRVQETLHHPAEVSHEPLPSHPPRGEKLDPGLFLLYSTLVHKFASFSRLMCRSIEISRRTLVIM